MNNGTSSPSSSVNPVVQAECEPKSPRTCVMLMHAPKAKAFMARDSYARCASLAAHSSIAGRTVRANGIQAACRRSEESEIRIHSSVCCYLLAPVPVTFPRVSNANHLEQYP